MADREHQRPAGVHGHAREAAAPGPWFYATLVTPCPICFVGPGDRCLKHKNGGTRARFHYERYELARTLANQPIKRRKRA